MAEDPRPDAGHARGDGGRRRPCQGSALAVRGDASRAITLTGIEPAVVLQDRQDSGLHRRGRAAPHQRGHHRRHRTRQRPRRHRRRQAEHPGGFRRQPRADDHRHRRSRQQGRQPAHRLCRAAHRAVAARHDRRRHDDRHDGAGHLCRRGRSPSTSRPPIPVEADSWIKTNAQFFTAVQAQETSNTLIRLFVGLSVAFGIAAVLSSR